MPEDLSQLISALASDAVETRLRAARQFAKLGEESRAAAVPLVRAVNDVEEVREWSVSALEDLGTPAHEDLPALAELLASDSSADVRYWAATLLGRLGSEAAPAVPALARALDDESADLSVRQRSAWALGKIGPPAQGAIRQLERAAESDDPRLVRLATRALEAVSG